MMLVRGSNKECSMQGWVLMCWFWGTTGPTTLLDDTIYLTIQPITLRLYALTFEESNALHRHVSFGEKQVKFGSLAYLNGFPFGHGGSGYVVSSAAMRNLFEGKHNVANRWDEATINECCGVVMFAKALKEATGIERPTINGEKPFTIPYSEREWCQPIVTMHHVGREGLSGLYGFERKRNFTFPMRIKDLYHEFVAPQLAPIRPDWDNMSDDVLYLNTSSAIFDVDRQLSKAKTQDLSGLEKTAHLSFEKCRAACQADKECLQ
ncbi:uncharacterized protein Triagg1_10479 [Trichoderma aggressivum f. europaeum]|uniref:Glycosyltransferase family 31 protein n=1 Tax=Trichoderma aggressivum f. europaeum TaxID=173218 RepID=A0AAE1I774_9HYPO|nr:hypothetical protein Triagg1_10479 [Trichoderma aggressivum f. europaeum]